MGQQVYVQNWVISMKKNNYSAFTIMELMLVVIIIGLIAGFAIPNYNKSVERAYEQDAIMQLSTIHAAEQIYYAREVRYWPLDANPYQIDQINTSLKTNIIENGMTLICTNNPPNVSTFNCTAQRTGGGFTLRVNQAVLSASNPCCSAGSCPTVPAC